MGYFTVRTWKHKRLNPLDEWANTYEMQLDQELPFLSDEMATVVNSLVSYEETFHLSDTIFDRVVVSTIVEDSKPYNPNSLLVIPRSDEGDVEPNFNEVEALDTVLFVRRRASIGRNGKLFFRNVLIDSDVENVGGVPALSALGSVRVGAVMLAAEAFLGAALNAMVMYGRSQESKNYQPAGAGQKQDITYVYGPPHVRPVVSLDVAGVKRVQVDNRHFNRGRRSGS